MEEKAFEEAVLRLEPKLYRIAMAILWNAHDAEDALMEGILRAWQKRWLLRDASRMDAWLTRIVINACRDIQRRNRNRALPLDEAMAQAAEGVPDMALRQALQRLPEKYRLVVLLHHMDGYCLADVSRMLRLPQSTVKGRLYEGRRMLKGLLQGDDT